MLNSLAENKVSSAPNKNGDVVGVVVGDGPGEGVIVSVGVGVRVIESVGVGVGVSVIVGDGVIDGVSVTVSVGVKDGVNVGVNVGGSCEEVADGVNVGVNVGGTNCVGKAASAESSGAGGGCVNKTPKIINAAPLKVRKISVMML